MQVSNLPHEVNLNVLLNIFICLKGWLAVRTGQLRVAAHTDVSLFTIVVPHESAAMTLHTHGGKEGQMKGQTEDTGHAA